jgi:hypothetical protein
VVRFILCLILLAVPACSINQFGTSQVERIEGDGALVISLTGIGLHLDTFERNPSLSVGRYQAVHVFSTGCPQGFDTASMSTSDLFRALDPQLSVTRVTGVQLKAGSRELSLTIGVRELALLQLVDGASSTFRVLTFDAKELDNTFLRTCVEDFAD